MSVVNLRIVEPQHGTNFIDSGAAHLRGEVVGTPPATLFFKWYTNLAASPDPLAKALDTNVVLPYGSQAIVLSAKDVDADTVDAIKLVKHGGVTGGAPDKQPPATHVPCVVHVLKAIIAEPKLDGATLSKANATLSAQVPALWEDREYQSSINQLRYSWHFIPSGAPAGRASADFDPELMFAPPLNAKLTDPSSKLVAPFSFKPDFEIAPNVKVPIMRYQGPLPASVGTGSYTLKLRVRKTTGAAALHEVTRGVTLTA